jgi:hypothetical protein
MSQKPGRAHFVRPDGSAARARGLRTMVSHHTMARSAQCSGFNLYLFFIFVSGVAV